MAPMLHEDDGRDVVPHSYMVMLKPGVTASSFLQHRAAVSNVVMAAQNAAISASSADEQAMAQAMGFRHIFDKDTLQGYAGTFTPDVLAFIRAQPEVEYVEPDSVVQITALAQDDRFVRTMDEESEARRLPWNHPEQHLTEVGAPWGLARISHRDSLHLSTFNKYVYEAVGGEGVTAYIIDTGIHVDHEDFQGRARWGKTMPPNEKDVDAHGHGTHVAGTIGSLTYGVAKNTELVAVKVLGASGQGTMADVTAGVLWAITDAQRLTEEMLAHPTSPKAKKHRGFVANMSLGGGKSPTLDRAVAAGIAAGLHFGVAAGNENQDACNVSPAGTKHAVTVAASTIADERAYFSNKGSCVDIFGPGLNVLSTWKEGPRSVNTMSGTSMATPHIVGLMSYLLSIYGTDDFHLMKDVRPSRLGPFAVQDTSSWWTALWAVTQHWWPWWLTTRPALLDDTVEVMAVESVLHPVDLKKALHRFATPGALAALDPDTVNSLAFNNATQTL
ncbi:proteinase B [Malassezia pachydermatis]